MKLEIPEGNFEGYIFDCDGTLADTMPLHYKAWIEILSMHGVDFPETLFYSLGGNKTSAIVEMLNKTQGKQMSVEEVVHEKERAFTDLLDQVKPIQSVVDYARKLHGHFPLAVASGGLKHLVLQTLQHLGIDDMFPVVVTAEDVTHGKPSPEVFLLAAERMRVTPGSCLVFEDAPPGIHAARSAGMAYVLVPSSPVELSLD